MKSIRSWVLCFEIMGNLNILGMSVNDVNKSMGRVQSGIDSHPIVATQIMCKHFV